MVGTTEKEEGVVVVGTTEEEEGVAVGVTEKEDVAGAAEEDWRCVRFEVRFFVVKKEAIRAEWRKRARDLTKQRG
jgi:hypothetical protein